MVFLTESDRKRILVTGGAGFVGSHLVDTLMRDGHEVCHNSVLLSISLTQADAVNEEFNKLVLRVNSVLNIKVCE